MNVSVKSSIKQNKLISKIKKEHQKRETKLRIPISVVKYFYDTGQISDEEYKKYMLSSDPCYLPSLRKNDSKT